VFTSTGDYYRIDPDGGSVHYVGNIGGGPVDVQPSTFGQLKARYRDPQPQGR